MSELSIFAAAREAPTRVALVTEGREITYAELAERVRGVVGWLVARGIHPGRDTRVAVVAHPDPPTIELFLALMELGVPFVPLHPRLTEGEREKIVDDAAPALVVRDVAGEVKPEGGAPNELPPVDPQATMAILYTSGTTGRAKGAMLSRSGFVAAAAASAKNLGWREDDRWLLCMPIAHVGGLSIVTRCLSARRTVVLGGPRFSVDTVDAVLRRDRVTIASLVPTMLHQLFERDWQLPAGLRVVLLGGAASGAALLDRARERGVPVLTTYGLTEACAQVTTQRYGTPPGIDQGAGSPLDGVEIRIVNDEVQVRSPSVMRGYFPLGEVPNPFTEDGWLKTGDLGRLDDEGRLHLLSRRTDLIVTGGENVYPAEVEAALESLPAVQAACVFSVPDERWGQAVAVALVLREGHRHLSPSEALAGAPAKLATYKRPRFATTLDALPLNRSGKIDRVATRTLAASDLVAITYASRAH